MATSEAQKRATIKYASKTYKRIPLDLNKEYFETVLKPVVDALGIPVNTFIKDAISEKIARETEKK